MAAGANDERARGLRLALGPGFRSAIHFLGRPEEHWETLLPLALLVGLLSGAAAVLLRSGVHHLFTAVESLREHGFLVVLPAAGATLGVLLVRRVFREPPGHGVPEVIAAVCRHGGRLPKRSILSRWLGSLLNVGAGGSAGLEGPIVQTGAAIGSTIGGTFRLDERRRSVLLATGVAAGISGVFNAPLTGMIFAMEVVLAEWSALSIVPIVLGSVAATELARLVFGNAQSFLHVPFELGLHDLGACILLGIVAGFASVCLRRGIEIVGKLSRRMPHQELLAPAVFGLLVGLIGLVAPESIGEGYGAVQQAIRSELRPGIGLVTALVVMKIVATSATLGSGAPGGVFAPCLVLGALLGVAFHRVVAPLAPEAYPLSVEGGYALVAMSGLVAGVMQAPLTGILLVLEVTGGYEVILPLMVVSVLSLLVARRFDRYSLYTSELARRGELLRPGTDRRILTDVSLAETLDDDVTTIREDMTLAEFARVARRSNRNHFPVVDPETGRFLGMLHLGPLREILLDPELARVTLVGTMMETDVPRVRADASLADALEIFEASGAWVLPVVDGERFVGLLSKSKLFDHYRHELSVQTTE